MSTAWQFALIVLASFGLQQLLGVGALTAPEAVCGDPDAFNADRFTDAKCEGIADAQTCRAMRGFEWDDEDSECAIGFTTPGGADQAMLDACTSAGGTVTDTQTCQQQGDYFASLLGQRGITSLDDATCNAAHAQLGSGGWFFFWSLPTKCCGDTANNGACSRGQMFCESSEDFHPDTVSAGTCTDANQSACDALNLFEWRAVEPEEGESEGEGEGFDVPAPAAGECALLSPMSRVVADQECQAAGGFLQGDFSCADMNAMATVMANMGDVPWGTLNDDDGSCAEFFVATEWSPMLSRAVFLSWMGELCCDGGIAVCSSVDPNGCALSPEAMRSYQPSGNFLINCPIEDMLSWGVECALVMMEVISDLGCCMIPFVEAMSGDDAPDDFDAADAVEQLLATMGVDADASAMQGMLDCEQSFGIDADADTEETSGPDPEDSPGGNNDNDSESGDKSGATLLRLPLHDWCADFYMMGVAAFAFTILNVGFFS